MHMHATPAAGLLAAILAIGPAPTATAVQLGELDDCRSTIETFPVRPCNEKVVPKGTRQAMKRVRVLLLDPEAEDVPDRAARVAFQLDRANAAAERAEARGRLPERCAEVLHDQIRYAQACVARPLLEEQERGAR
jgi:hypothetical protein